MDTPPPDDVPPHQPPILLPAADLPPMGEPDEEFPHDRPATASPRPYPTRALLFLTVLGVGAVIYILLLIVGGPGRRFALDGLEVLPFVGLVLLAYAGERNDVCRLLTLIYWALLVGSAAVVNIAVASMTQFDMAAVQKAHLAALANNPANLPPTLLLPHAKVKIALTVVGCLAAVVIGGCAFTRPVRRWASQALSAFDADSFVHAVALATVVSLTQILFTPLIVSGEPPFLTIVRNFTAADLGDQANGLAAAFSDQNMLVDQVLSFVWLVPVGIVAVGWPLHRTLPEALRRVGFVVPRVWQVAFGLGLAIVLAVVMSLADAGIGRLWDILHWPRTDEKAFEQLFKSLTSPIGAVVIAITAGIGEELFTRGILQPRLGIILSNLFFTSLHALQYNWDALLSVFVVGLILGIVRKKTNTSTSAIVHGTYDFLLVLAAYHQFDPMKLFGGG